MIHLKGIVYAALSSSTFGLAPLFTVILLQEGLSPFDVLTYRWGVASLALLPFVLASGWRFRLDRRNFGAVFLLSLLRAGCSFSLVLAYANIATGVASTIHFLYPLAVAVAMTLLFHERFSGVLFTAIVISLAGAVLLSAGEIRSEGGNPTIGIVAACFSVVSYAGYIIGVRKTRAAQVESTALTFLVMAISWVGITGHRHFEHHAGQGDQSHRADTILDSRSVGAAHGRCNRSPLLWRTPYNSRYSRHGTGHHRRYDCRHLRREETDGHNAHSSRLGTVRPEGRM